MTEAITPNQNKRLSQLKQIAVDIVSGIQSVIMSRDLINQRLEEGRRLGFSDIEIGDAIRAESKGRIPDRTVRYYLPDTAKHTKFANEAATLPPKQLNTPPPPQVVREPEIIREPPKPINEPIPIPKAESKIIKGVVFDPAPIDRDRTQVFILDIDVDTKKVKEYKTVGRRSIR